MNDGDFIAADDAPASLEKPVEHVGVLGAREGRSGPQPLVEAADVLESLSPHGEVEAAAEAKGMRRPAVDAGRAPGLELAIGLHGAPAYGADVRRAVEELDDSRQPIRGKCDVVVR